MVKSVGAVYIYTCELVQNIVPPVPDLETPSLILKIVAGSFIGVFVLFVIVMVIVVCKSRHHGYQQEPL
jgi:hypothetical protein